MKYIAVFLSSLFLCLSMASCTGQGSASSSASSLETSGSVSSASSSETAISSSTPSVPDMPPIVADAALYRGTVAHVEPRDEAGSYLVTLERAAGTSFGAPSMSFIVTEPEHTIELGQYWAIYYGGQAAGTTEPFTAITAQKLPDADLCLYNGTIVEITPDETDGNNGDILLQALDNSEDTILFHYDSGTQFYLTRDELKVGDKLNVYFSGATTRSIPPQATAWEIRYYAESTSAQS